MNTWIAIGTVASAAIALLALGISASAFRRSGLTDRRAHEYRNVKWIGKWESAPSGDVIFSLTNSGSTIAKQTRAHIYIGTGYYDALNLGTFKPGATKVAYREHADSQAAAEVLIAAIRRNGEPFTVNSLSKLGTPESFQHLPPQIF